MSRIGGSWKPEDGFEGVGVAELEGADRLSQIRQSGMCFVWKIRSGL